MELITNDSESFKCFVECANDNTDKVVNKEFDTAHLECLFRSHHKDGKEVTDQQRRNAEQKIVEFLNGIKHEANLEDEMRKEEAAL